MLAMFLKMEHTRRMVQSPLRTKSTPGGRILEVLETFTYGPPQQTLDQVQAASGLPRTTAYRTLRILVSHSWITHSKGGYSLGENALQFVQRFNRELLRSSAASALNDLQLASGAVAHLSILEGPLVCHIDKVGGRAWKEIPSHIGTRLPAVSTAAGRAMLAALPDEITTDLLRLHAEAGLPDFDAAELSAEFLASKSSEGVLVRDGHRHLSGISTAAAPIIIRKAPVAAISLAWKGERTSLAHAAKLVHATAQSVTRELLRQTTF